MANYEKRAEIVKMAKGYLGVKAGSERHKEILGIYNKAVLDADGVKGYKPVPRKHQMTVGEAWCATFVSAIGILAGVKEYPLECSCNNQIKQLTAMKEWEEADDYLPSPGDILYYDWQDSGKGDNTGAADHVGIVEKVSAGKITVIEGNMSGKVGRRTITVNGRYIRGFGKISFEEETAKTVKKTETSRVGTVKPAIGLNVRKGPGTGYAKIAALKCGAKVTILEEDSGWGKIKVSGQVGWVCMEYIRE